VVVIFSFQNFLKAKNSKKLYVCKSVSAVGVEASLLLLHTTTIMCVRHYTEIEHFLIVLGKVVSLPASTSFFATRKKVAAGAHAGSVFM
jgi:hypothetical protein